MIKMVKYSHSRLSCFQTCPLKFKFQYVDGIKTHFQDTIETFLGSRVHEALEKLYLDLKFEKLNSMEELLEYFNNQWAKNWDDNILIVKKEYTSENYRKMGERYIKDYYEKHKPFNKGRTIGLETEDTLYLDSEKKYSYHVRIDRFMDMGNGFYEIHDYKTNNKLPTQEYLDADRQLAMYSIWVKENFKDFKKVRLVWHFLAFNKEMSSERTSSELDLLKESVVSLIKEIEDANEYYPNETALCSYCYYQELCPKRKHLFKLENLPKNKYLNEPGVKLVNKYSELVSQKKEILEKIDPEIEELKDALIKYSKKEECEIIGGTNFNARVKIKEKENFPKTNTSERNELDNLIKENGKWDDTSNLNIFELSKILKEKRWNLELIEKVNKFVSKTESSQIYLSKKKEK